MLLDMTPERAAFRTKPTLRSIVAMALAGVLGAAVLTVSFSPALAADDDDDEWYDQKMLKGMMRGLGLRNGGEATIEYHERSPLVVPPSRELPRPEGEAAAKSAAWPKDQDVERRKAAKAASKQKVSGGDAVNRWEAIRDQYLTPDQWKQGKVDKGTEARGAGSRPADEGSANSSERMSPSALGYKPGAFSDMWKSTFSKEPETTKFDKEPDRAALTDPPSGYRTPSAAQPYGLSKEDTKNKPTTLYDRATGGDMGKR